MGKVSQFTLQLVEKLRGELQKLQSKANAAEKENQATKDVLLQQVGGGRGKGRCRKLLMMMRPLPQQASCCDMRDMI